MKASPASTKKPNPGVLLLSSFLLLVLLSGANAMAGTSDNGYLVAPTSYGWSQMPASINNTNYGASEVIQFFTDGIQAFTSDYVVADWIDIQNPQDGGYGRGRLSSPTAALPPWIR